MEWTPLSLRLADEPFSSAGKARPFPREAAVILIGHLLMQSEQLLRNISPRMALRQRSVCLSVFCIRTLHQVCTRPPSLNIARHSIVKRCLKVPRQVGLSPPTVEELSILYQERLREFRSKRTNACVKLFNVVCFK